MKIRTLPITEWNYKGTDASIKYIGPVAQDFYSAFHLGGNDSLGINSLCIDGVNIAAIKALEKRTSEFNAALTDLKAEKEKVALLENQMIQQKVDQAQYKASQEKINAILTERIEKLTNLITSLTTTNNPQLTINK